MKKERDAVQLIQRLLNNLGREARVYEDVEPIDREHDEIVLEMRRLVESAAAAPQPPVGGNPVKRWEPRNTIVGYDMEPRDDGSFVLYEEVTARDQQITALQARIKQLEGGQP